MECYIFRPDKTGRKFMLAMMERARAGMIVTVVVDAIGSFRFGLTAIREMREAGCRVELYQRPTWYRLSRLNNRTHRELLVVDGKTAFMGGAGVGEQWAKSERGKRPWRDTMVRVTGPVVSSFQGVFAETWVECCGEILTGPEYFPDLKKTGDTSTIVIKSSPSDRATACRVVFQLLIDEVNVAIRDEELSDRLTKDFFHDLKSCKEVTLETWKRRPWFEKIVEPFAWILERQQ